MYKSIVVGTDGSDTASEAVRAAIGLAKQSGAKLRIVSAFEPVSKVRLREEARSAPADVQWAINPLEDVDTVLGEALGWAQQDGVSAESLAREGDPADALLDVAEEQGCDLLVVGNKGMSGVKRFLLGSVPNRVAHHAPCSVLIVHTS